MRRFLLASVAVLALAGTAHAEWETDCRHGWISKNFGEIDKDLPPVEIVTSNGDTSLRISYDELKKLVKELPAILRNVKACDAWMKCLSDRDAGKVKHCYYNDRRWRD
jgi:hypothetical protein